MLNKCKLDEGTEGSQYVTNRKQEYIPGPCQIPSHTGEKQEHGSRSSVSPNHLTPTPTTPPGPNKQFQQWCLPLTSAHRARGPLLHIHYLNIPCLPLNGKFLANLNMSAISFVCTSPFHGPQPDSMPWAWRSLKTFRSEWVEDLVLFTLSPLLKKAIPMASGAMHGASQLSWALHPRQLLAQTSFCVSREGYQQISRLVTHLMALLLSGILPISSATFLLKKR